MVEWARTDAGVWAIGRDGRSRVGVEGWRSTEPRRALPTTVDASVAGAVERLRLPTATPTVTGPDGRVEPVGRLDPGEYLLQFDEGVETVIRFDGPATLTPGVDAVELLFDGREPVTLGFREEPSEPPAVRVPATAAGVARAVSLAGSAHRTQGPARSHPAFREHPPLLSFGETDIPDSLETAMSDDDAVFYLPDAMPYVLVAAPLGYYLGAEVRCEDRRAPLLELVGHDHAFSRLPAFAEEVAVALRRLLYADSLARRLHCEPAVDAAPLTAAGLEAGTLRSASPARRALWILDRDALDEHLPEWHLAAYVDPSPDRVRALPYLLDHLALVYPASASGLSSRELLSRTLEDFFRAGDTPSVRAVEPELGTGRLHAWLADDVPIDAFATSATAHEHGFRRGRGDRLTVDVVCNDVEMADEHLVVDRYRERAAELPVEVRRHDSLDCAALATVFERETDFVHYVGHCEHGGLRCRDGTLDVSSLDSVGARTFFLNACGSYHEGAALVDGGAVAGGVTLRKVLNAQAVTVGAAFARLLAHGFGFERALSLARRRIMMGKDYAVVGDGTYRLLPPCGHAAVLHADAIDGGYRVKFDVLAADGAGRRYRDPLSDTAVRLYGDSATDEVSAADLADFCQDRAFPVVLDGRFRWADDVARELAG